jgi:putative addiction module CopG family antidote
MTITLNPELDRLVREKLVSGQYGSVEDVLTAAMRALNAEEESIAAIAEGFEDIEAGRFCSLKEANAEFYRKHSLPAHE